MASNQYGQNLVFNGLGTFTLLTAPFAAAFLVSGKITLPLPTGSGQSAVTATLKKNGSNVVVGVAGATGFESTVTCAVGDVLTVVLASAAAVDQPINVIKTTVSVSYV